MERTIIIMGASSLGMIPSTCIHQQYVEYAGN